MVVFSISAVVFLCGLVAVQCHSATSTQTYRLHQELDPAGIYTLYWEFNNTHVTFEVHVKTLGYVGFGISPNGRMRGSDVVIGWVEDDGTAHFAVSDLIDWLQSLKKISSMCHIIYL